MAACGGSSQQPGSGAQSPQAQYGAQPGYAQPPPVTAPTEKSPVTKKGQRRATDAEVLEEAPPTPTPAAPAPPPAAAAGAPEPPPEAPGAMDPRARYARANVQLSEARRMLDVAAGQRDCANACRALDSMERAAGQICELARSTEERRTCKSAEDQVGTARERVKNACGECPKRP
jgi:hypothetical protein